MSTDQNAQAAQPREQELCYFLRLAKDCCNWIEEFGTGEHALDFAYIQGAGSSKSTQRLPIATAISFGPPAPA